MERNPDFSFRRRELETGRHHANDLSACPLKLDRTADHVGIPSEALLPKIMTENHVAVIACGVFAGNERTAQVRTRAEH